LIDFCFLHKYMTNLFIVETPITKANNLKVTIGAAELARCNEIQISQSQCSEICKSNYPIADDYWEQSREAEGLIHCSLLWG
jgi:hypothetical protein